MLIPINRFTSSSLIIVTSRRNITIAGVLLGLMPRKQKGSRVYLLEEYILFLMPFTVIGLLFVYILSQGKNFASYFLSIRLIEQPVFIYTSQTAYSLSRFGNNYSHRYVYTLNVNPILCFISYQVLKITLSIIVFYILITRCFINILRAALLLHIL